MACQAVAAFMLELAHFAFLALPRAVVAIAGSHCRVCQGLLGPGCVAWSVVCALALQVSFHIYSSRCVAPHVAMPDPSRCLNCSS